MPDNSNTTMKHPNIPILCAATLLVALPVAARAGFPDYVPLKINQTVDSVYPRSAVDVGLTSGFASVAVSIDETGILADYLILAYSHPKFAENAVGALKQWTFEPAQVHGSARSCEADLTFRYEVRGVVLVSMTPLTTNEMIRFRIA